MQNTFLNIFKETKTPSNSERTFVSIPSTQLESVMKTNPNAKVIAATNGRVFVKF